MQTSMTGRPRPVTATVTKPKWMQIPNPDALRKIRRKSVESTGSTASLTSLVDHDSYESASDTEPEGKKTPHVRDSDDKVQDKGTHHQKRTIQVGTESSRDAPTKSKSTESNLSAWERWIIEKAKEDHKKKMAERQRKKQEKIEKERQEQEKRTKIMKAEVKRQAWVEQKNQEQNLQKKMEKLLIREQKRKKEEIDAQIKQKASEKFAQWQEMKKKEEKERRHKIKEENQRIQQHEVKRKQMAEAKFQEWLKMAKDRPKSVPNSFGYLSGKMTGYHDRSAYPQPTFCNPIPWQPIAVPPSNTAEKKAKPKAKPYKWSPEKYL